MFTVLAGLQRLTVLCLHQSLKPPFTNRMQRHSLSTALLTRGIRSGMSHTMRNTAAAQRYKAVRERERKIKQNKIPLYSLDSRLTESIQ